MPDRPSGPPRGGTGDSEYGWLYGGGRSDASGARPDSDDPEPTQVFPQAGGSRSERYPGSSGSGGYWADDDPPTQRIRRQEPPRRPEPPRRDERSTPPSGPPPRRDRPRGGRRERPPWLKLVLALLALWLVFLVAVPIWAWSRVEKVDAFPPEEGRPADQPGTTYLLVGSDSRKGLTQEEKQKLGVGGVGDVGQRTDTIMLLHTGAGPNLLLSIPRDSYVPIPGYGYNKINAAYALGGPKLLVRTIEQDTGVRVDDYVELGFGGFVNIMDAVGGVRICPKRNLDDPKSNLHVEKGCQNVDGATALAFARDRHSFGLGDVQRAKNQRKVLASAGHKVKSPWTFINPFRYMALAKAGADGVRMSKGSGPFALAGFVLAMMRGGKNCTMPIADLYVHWDRTRALALMRLIKEDRLDELHQHPGLCTPSGLPG